MKKLIVRSWMALLVVSATYCTPSSNQNDQNQSEDVEPQWEDTQMETPVSATARAELSSASSSTVSGQVVFTEVGQDSVELQLSITGAEPGEHALHLHENGDCSAEDASSAGGHWNPTNNQHGQRGSGEFHKGDVMNLTVEENGNAEVSMVVTGWTIGGNQQSNILNKAVIIHAGADDFTSQPSGDAGKRIACGVIVED